MKKQLCLSIALIMICALLASCGQSAGETSQNSAVDSENSAAESTTESSAEIAVESPAESDAESSEAAPAADSDSPYFEFSDDGTTVRGLTEEGMKQTALVVPAAAQAFSGFSFDECDAEEVSFEADHDVEIGEVFRAAASLKKVALPAELSVIPDSAFSMCSGLESIVIPAGVARIEGWAFDYCESLKEVTFAGTACETIGEYAFSSCAIEEITLPEGLRTVENSAFESCEQLVSITFPSTIESIGGHLCNGDSLTELHFAPGAENVTIDPFAFMTRTSQITVYIAKDSWMDQNRNSWNVGFGAIEYE